MTSLLDPGQAATHFRIPTAVSVGYSKTLRENVREALRLGARQLVVDCDSWNRFDMNLLSSLIQCAAICRELGASFVVTNLPDAILKDVRALQLETRLGLT